MVIVTVLRVVRIRSRTMSDFKHVEEMIAKLPKGCCWLKKDVGGSHHDDPCPACREKRAAADTMQALLDRNKLLEDVAEVAQAVLWSSDGDKRGAIKYLDKAIAKL